MSLVRGNPFLFSGLWFISCSIEENGLPHRFTPRNDRLVLSGRVDFYIVLYCKSGTAQRPSPTIIFIVHDSARFLFPSALVYPLATPQSALRLAAPLRGAPLRGKDFGLAWPRCPQQKHTGSFAASRVFSLSKKSCEDFFDKLHPPSILILSKCCFAPKVVDVSRLLDGGLSYLRRAFSRCGSVTARL